jgi:hypothetical protein
MTDSSTGSSLSRPSSETKESLATTIDTFHVIRMPEPAAYYSQWLRDKRNAPTKLSYFVPATVAPLPFVNPLEDMYDRMEE